MSGLARTLLNVTDEAKRIDEDELRTIGAGLLASWNAQGDSFTPSRPGRDWTKHQLAAVFALTVHVHRVFVPAARLLDEGCVVEAIPLIRTAYECALTALWIAQTDDGVDAFLNKDVTSRANAERTAQKAVSEALRNGGPIAGADLDDLETSASGPARNFDQLCDDLTPGGADAYFHYRAMSMYQHPSVLLVDQYLSLSDDGTDFAAFHMQPKQQETAPWRGLLTACLIWSGRAVDDFDGSRKRRSELIDAAKTLGVAETFQLSEKARLRQEKFKQAGRRAGWVGPRPRKRKSELPTENDPR